MSTMRNQCEAAKHFSEKCQGKYDAEPREIVFNCRDFEGNPSPVSSEWVHLCDFHYNWLKTMGLLEMHGETLADALENDLLTRFKDQKIFRVWRQRGTYNHGTDGNLYLLEGDEHDTAVPLKGAKYTWELEGVFCYNEYRKSSIFEILPITKPDVMKWLSESKEIYLCPWKTRKVWMSKETGIIVPEEEVSQVNGGCYYGEIKNTQEYTSIARDFEMFGSYLDIKEHFWRKNEAMEAREFQKCMDFICDELTDPQIFNWNDVYGDCPVALEDVYLLKQALVTGNQPTIDRFKKDYSDCSRNLHAIMWAVYAATNHQLYWKNSFGKTPDSVEDEEGYKCFLKRLVTMFVEEGLANALLCLAISGARQRDVGIKMREYYNIMHPNFEVVKMLIPAQVDMRDEIYDGLTAWEYWNCYDNRLFNIRSCANGYGGYDDYEEFSKDEFIGEFLRPMPEQSNGQREETAEAQGEPDFGKDKVIGLLMKHSPGMDKEQAEKKLKEMMTSVVVEYF
jgi:hypothetical protein